MDKLVIEDANRNRVVFLTIGSSPVIGISDPLPGPEGGPYPPRQDWTHGREHQGEWSWVREY